ncbi:MAG: SUMF1/EgtB/PvdO family nonheme iron enzyme, partial [Myxococcota bacterium]|nr:SUMF1/EgtB/PvdO family nonheme iron enzyme [Myxococcota bacterium]
CTAIADGYVYIPEGTFMMGSPVTEPCRDDDELQRAVTLTRPFAMKATEVTQGEWQALMGTAPSANGGCDDCPVETVSWWGALAYANALSASEGLDACYTLSGCAGAPGDGAYVCDDFTVEAGTPYACEGYRLPTETEWERGARAGTTTSVWHGTIEICDGVSPVADEVGWHQDNAGGVTHLVAQKLMNPWGLYDTAGNVSEWCSDWYGAGVGAAVDPEGPPSGGSRVTRSYSWSDQPGRIRAANRSFDAPGARGPSIGFRPVRTLPVDADGDGVDHFEDCDEADPDFGVTCCGNSALDPGESCDDGGLVDGDGCSAACELEPQLDCAEHLLLNPDLPDGVYAIDPDGEGGAEPFHVYCDMTTDGGGWTKLFIVGDGAEDWSYINTLGFEEFTTCSPEDTRWTHGGEASTTYINELQTTGDYSQPAAWSMVFDQWALGN